VANNVGNAINKPVSITVAINNGGDGPVIDWKKGLSPSVASHPRLDAAGGRHVGFAAAVDARRNPGPLGGYAHGCGVVSWIFGEWGVRPAARLCSVVRLCFGVRRPPLRAGLRQLVGRYCGEIAGKFASGRGAGIEMKMGRGGGVGF